MNEGIIDWLLKTEVKTFISQNQHLSTSARLLKIPSSWQYKPWIASQTECKEKAQKKLPSWFQHAEILWPLKLNIEQCSSEKTAQYKASLLQSNVLMDGTGGFGVDTYFFSKSCQSVVHVEKSNELSQIAKYNFEQLKSHNITCINDLFENALETADNLDVVYLDPARRVETEKVFLFKDCIPNVIELKNTIFIKTKILCVKASPMIDLQKGIEELGNVKAIHVISVQNECKEILFILEKTEQTQPTTIYCINFQNHTIQTYNNTLENEKSTDLNYYASPIKKYLYEPNASIMKAGFFKSICKTYQLEKLHTNTHLYTSMELIQDFPGKIFEIEHNLSSKELKKYIPDLKMNFHLRNFPAKIDALKKELKIKEGGIHDVFATTIYPNEKRLLICKRVIFS